MAYYKKWKIQHPNIQPGDVVLLEDQNAIRGLWKLGIVKNVNPVRDTISRNVQIDVVRKNGSKILLFTPIQKQVLFVPKNEQV